MMKLCRKVHVYVKKGEPSFYEILGINQNATKDEIKSAYLIQAKKYHPDINKFSNEMFLKVKNAWSVLGDSEKKIVYDKELKKLEEWRNEYSKKSREIYDEKFDMDDLNMHKSPESIFAKFVVMGSLLVGGRFLYVWLLKENKK